MSLLLTLLLLGCSARQGYEALYLQLMHPTWNHFSKAEATVAAFKRCYAPMLNACLPVLLCYCAIALLQV
jgi:hypothetical protein